MMVTPETQVVAQAMTPELWKKVGERLSYPYGRVKLQCDEYVLTLAVVSVKALRQEIMIYVDGHARGIWLQNDCEERRRFLRPRRVPIFSSREKARFKAAMKGLRKSDRDREMESLNRSIIVYQLTWPAFSPLKRHLIANNKVIALLPESDL